MYSPEKFFKLVGGQDNVYSSLAARINRRAHMSVPALETLLDREGYLSTRISAALEEAWLPEVSIDLDGTIVIR